MALSFSFLASSVSAGLAQENDWGYDHVKKSGSGVDSSRVHDKADSRDGGNSGRSAERDTSATGMSAKAGSLDWDGKGAAKPKTDDAAESPASKKSATDTSAEKAEDQSTENGQSASTGKFGKSAPGAKAEKAAGATAQGKSGTAPAKAGAAAKDGKTAAGKANPKDAKSATAAATSASDGAKPVDKVALTNLKELLELASGHKLSPDQVTDLTTLLPKYDPTKKAAPAPPLRPGWSNPTTPASVQAEWLKISTFWPEVNKRLQEHQDEADDFSRLFKALLRLVIASKSLPEEQTTILLNIVGPERIAVEGDPQLTEEAVNGYTDMACFLFEMKNPGKTVDADDNRAVFATVIKSKFQEAPSEKAKLAMANFALTWAKFKIAWDLAPDDRKKELSQHVDEIASGTSYSDTSLTKKIFDNGPWHRFLAKAPG